MLVTELKRSKFSRNSTNDGNTTKEEHGNTAWSFNVPHASIILLSLLACCLFALLVMYIVIRRCERRLLDRLTGKGRKSIQYEARSPKIGLEDGQISDENYELYPQSPRNTRKHKKQGVYQKHPPLRSAVMQVSVTFSPNTGRLVVEIGRLKSVAKKLLQSGFAASVVIHARLQPLPDKFRYTTSSKPINKPEFHERFAFDGFSKDDLRKCWFRFRLYSQRRMGKNKLLGQVNVGVMDFEVDGVWSALDLDVLPSEQVHKLLIIP